MKIETGRHNQQISFGVTLTNYHNEHRAVIIDFGLWYVEIIFKTYET